MEQALRTIATFQSEKFNVDETQEHFINPGCFGDDLCQWIIGKLQMDGVDCDPAPGQEDFGWYFNFSLDKAEYCCVCLLREADGDDPALWVLWIERNTGFFAGLVGARDKNISADSSKLMHEILSKSPDISHLRWHYKKDFDSGSETAGSETPA